MQKKHKWWGIAVQDPLMTKFLQINIGECREAHDLMMAVAKLNADIIAVSEPNKALAANIPE